MSKMIAEVFFNETDDFGNKIGHELVATVTLESNRFDDTDEALEHVYSMIQNCSGSWSRGQMVMGIENTDYNPAIKLEKPLTVYNGHEYGHRSMMVGDRIVLEDRMYEVNPRGFKEILMTTIEED